MQKGDGVLGRLVPTDQDAPEAVQPAVGAFPHPRGIWSWPHPGSANSSPAPATHHSAPAPPAIAPGIPQPSPIPESADGRWSQNKCPWHPMPSTGSQCAGRRRCRWRKSGREPEAGRRPKDGCSPAGAAAGPTPAITRRRSERNWWWRWLGSSPCRASVAQLWGHARSSFPKISRIPRFLPCTALARFSRFLG